MRVDGNLFLQRALRYIGRPYIWGAEGPDGFDCSGLVKRVIHDCHGPNWLGGPPWYNAAKLFTTLDPYLAEARQMNGLDLPMEVPAGTLVFYGAPVVDDKHMHVMIAVGDGRVFGACGGGQATLTRKDGAEVQYRHALRYRPDIRGLRQLPEVVR